MKINNFQNPTNVTTQDDLKRYTSIALSDIVNVINGNVSLSDNCSTNISSIEIKSPNADTVITHGLGRIPDGYIIVGNPRGVVIKDGVTASTTSILTIQGDRVGTVKVLVF